MVLEGWWLKRSRKASNDDGCRRCREPHLAATCCKIQPMANEPVGGDLVDDFLRRLQDVLSKARGQPAQKGDVAQALGLSSSQLSHLRNPEFPQRRTVPQLSRLHERAARLVEDLCKSKSAATLTGGLRLDSKELAELLGPFAIRSGGSCRLVDGVLLNARPPSRHPGPPKSLETTNQFLGQNTCQPEQMWVPHVDNMHAALQWTKGKHRDPQLDHVYRTTVNAAHCINAMTPVIPSNWYDSPSEQRLVRMTREVVHRIRKTGGDVDILCDGYRLLGYHYQAEGQFGAAVREFEHGMRAVRAISNTHAEKPVASMQVLDLAILSAKLQVAGPRSLGRMEDILNVMQSSYQDGSMENARSHRRGP